MTSSRGWPVKALIAALLAAIIGAVVWAAMRDPAVTPRLPPPRHRRSSWHRSTSRRSSYRRCHRLLPLSGSMAPIVQATLKSKSVAKSS